MIPSVKPKPFFTSSSFASGEMIASSARSNLTTGLSACPCARGPANARNPKTNASRRGLLTRLPRSQNIFSNANWPGCGLPLCFPTGENVIYIVVRSKNSFVDRSRLDPLDHFFARKIENRVQDLRAFRLLRLRDNEQHA